MDFKEETLKTELLKSFSENNVELSEIKYVKVGNYEMNIEDFMESINFECEDYYYDVDDIIFETYIVGEGFIFFRKEYDGKTWVDQEWEFINFSKPSFQRKINKFNFKI